MKKKIIFYIHSIAGLVSGLFILLMSISGAALVLHDELDTMQQPEIKPWPFKNITVDSGYHVIQNKFPHAQISNCEIPENTNSPFSFFIYDTSYEQGTKVMQVFLHPQTGLILNSRGGSDDMKNSFMSWLSKFHNSFHLGKTGEWLLGFFALIFLLSIITGFILFRENILAVLLFKKEVYKRSNLHQLIGVYALIFNLMIAVTGFWMQRYVFKKEFYASYNYTPVLKASPSMLYRFDSAYNGIRKQYPDFTAHVIYFPQSSSGSTYVYGSRASKGYLHSQNFADEITLDSTGSISSTRLFEENSPSDRYDIINSQLHMGNFGGAGIKIIYFVFGLTGALLSITGFGLWWRRRKEKNSRCTALCE